MGFPKLPSDIDRSEANRCLAKCLAYIANRDEQESRKWFVRLAGELKLEDMLARPIKASNKGT